MKFQSKSADLTIDKIIVIILAAVFVIGFFSWLFAFNGLTVLKNVLPTFGTGTTAMAFGDASSQPLELRGDDPCINFDFYWADAKGANINGQKVSSGLVYIAISFKNDIGNLNDPKNPKYFCGTYSLVETDITKSLSIASLFQSIQKKYTPKNIGEKIYYFVPVIAESGSFFKNREYTFDILKKYPDKTTIVRRGFPLHVK